MDHDPDIEALFGADPTAVSALWSCLTTDPTAAVVMFSRTFEVLFVDPRTAKDFGGPRATPADYVGRPMDGCGMDPGYVRERRAYCAAVLEDGLPRLVRSIWRGCQFLLWFTPMGRGEGGRPDRVLVVGRRLPGIGIEQTLTDLPTPLIFADTVELGPLNRLTARELEVLALIGGGRTIKEAALDLHRSPKTVEKHRLAAGRKLRLHGRAELIEVAQRAGLLMSDAARTRITRDG